MKKEERIEVIDLLRGLSCLGVLLFHLRVDLWIGWWRITSYPQEYSTFAKAMAWLSIPTPFLGYAILLFFLISGFCIHYPNTAPMAKPCWKTYSIRRFWRIYPTYLIALLLTSVISFYCYVKWGDQTWDPKRILRVATISQNYPPQNGQFLSNPSLWTIPLEIEFYILYPLAFWLLTILRRPIFLMATALFLSGICVYLTKQGKEWLSFTALFLWPSWLLGTWVASLYRDKKLHSFNTFSLAAVLTVLLVFALFSRLRIWETWIQYGLWTGFYFCLFIFFLQKNRFFSSFGDFFLLRLLSWLGKISFSLYLIHFPLFKLFGYWHREFFAEKPANFLVSLLYLIPVVFLAFVFYVWVEQPIHHWSKNRKLAK